MIYVIPSIAIVLTLIVYALYLIGKKVKEKEAILKKMMSERDAKARLSKYKRKSTPKVPTIQK